LSRYFHLVFELDEKRRLFGYKMFTHDSLLRAQRDCPPSRKEKVSDGFSMPRLWGQARVKDSSS
jgi:hypothetical protein